ncbi:MAG: bifunctional 4-hydroxy-3-methylbut-2-enyl diphosphate reductase/30S ribosomal protein S1 [Firmicutes bacterium]|nr:bifunctional 4-hydroxy-3-methylbut-2-enyl diphosphate reductase/30S ribosomal protein S1 [Bacillota bacterium]
MRTVILAEHAGFCFGVKKAVNTAYEELEKAAADGVKLYCLGSLIHNRVVTDELKEKGLITVSSIEDVPDGSRVLIRAHGEPDETYRKAGEKGVHIIDATCPLVGKVHKIAKDVQSKGGTLLVIGDRDHPEVIGILGSTEGPAFAAATPEEAAEFARAHKGEAVTVVSQTTLTEESFEKCSEAALEAGGEGVEIINTICNATQQRQKAAADLSKKADYMVVLGDEQSSNYKKLLEICKKHCSNVVTDVNLPLQIFPKNCIIGVAAGASTPERIIKEVIARMSETQKNQNEEILDMSQMMDEIEKSLKLPGRNEDVEGTVVQVTNDYVVVNIGRKKDGMLPKTEVALEKDQELKDLFHEGDKLSAKVIKTDDGDGNILLSTKRLQSVENWDELNAAMESRDVVNVTVAREVKGGVIANYKEVSGFIPMSQLADHYVETAEEFIGKTLPVVVTRVDQRRNKAVFSHKAFLTGERDKKLAEVWEQIHVGDVVEGKVMRFTDYGAFVDIGGIDGLLHISEISWGKLKHPQEVLEIGQVIDVKILSMNAEKGKISLGYKQNNPEPWSVIDEGYQVGQVVKGKVVQLKEYGAFVELAPGLDGLVHISEIAHKRVNKVSEELQVGQEVEAKILEIDKERRRISLSIKATLDEPDIYESEEKAPEVLEAVEGAVQDVEELKEKAEEAADEVKEAVAEAGEVVTEAVEE